MVDKIIIIHPGIDIKNVIRMLPDYNHKSVRTAYRRNIKASKKDEELEALNIKKELTKIIKDYKQPASARVQAIREYNNLVEITPESSDDPLLKLLTTLEKES